METSGDLARGGLNWNRIYAQAVFYPTLGWNYLLARVLRRRRWWDRVDPLLIVGAYPFAGDVAEMSAEGVTGVVNTCEEYAGPAAEYQAAGIEQFRMPTVDFTHPDIDDVVAAVAFIDRHVDAGGGVYVHCKAGRARSATVAMAWLMRRHGIDADEAQRRLLAARPHVNPNVARRPVIAEFGRRMREAATDEKNSG